MKAMALEQLHLRFPLILRHAVKDKCRPRLLHHHRISSAWTTRRRFSNFEQVSPLQQDQQSKYSSPIQPPCISHKVIGQYGGHHGSTTQKLSYFRGWAYQQVFLNRRIQYKRESKQLLVNDDSLMMEDLDRDRILFFEHDHVYTLGRGADEKNLTFLSEHDRQRLCRKNRNGDGSSSRLFGDSILNKRRIHLQDRVQVSVKDEVDSLGKKENKFHFLHSMKNRLSSNLFGS